MHFNGRTIFFPTPEFIFPLIYFFFLLLSLHLCLFSLVVDDVAIYCFEENIFIQNGGTHKKNLFNGGGFVRVAVYFHTKENFLFSCIPTEAREIKKKSWYNWMKIYCVLSRWKFIIYKRHASLCVMYICIHVCILSKYLYCIRSAYSHQFEFIY